MKFGPKHVHSGIIVLIILDSRSGPHWYDDFIVMLIALHSEDLDTQINLKNNK